MKAVVFISTLIIMIGCSSDKAGQNLYLSSEVGKTKRIVPCTVISTRDVMIRESNSGDKGEIIGFIVGAVATADNSEIPLFRYLGGLFGAAVGRGVSDKLHERPGVEYTVLLVSGEERQLIQDINKNETLLIQGETCRMQTTGRLNRILPAAHYPDNVKRPMKTQFTD